MTRRLAGAVALGAFGLAAAALHAQEKSQFRSGVELINVTATVSDAHGRFVPGLQQDDFVVYEDDQPQESRTSAPSACRSASASCSTPAAAWPARRSTRRAARSIGSSSTCSIADDEMFLYRFSNYPMLVQGWTTRPRSCCRARSARIAPNGGTAMYDAVAEAHPAGAARAEPEEGARRHLRRQRHVEPHAASAS